MNKIINDMVEKVGGFTYGDDGNRFTPVLLGNREIKEYTEMVIAHCAIALSQATNGGTLEDKFYQNCKVMNKYFEIKP